MRNVPFIAILLLLLASCEKVPPLEIDESGTPRLDTARVDTKSYEEVNLPCQQVLIVEAGLDGGNSFALSLILAVYAEYVIWIDSSYRWAPTGDTTRTIIVPDFPGDRTYEVEISYAIGIEYLDTNSGAWRDSTLILLLSDEIIIRRNNIPLYVIPHAFTPNGDGFNDEFKIAAICFSTSRLRIFDTFSNTLLFESREINSGWDGTYEGKKMPVEEYRYQFEIASVNNQVFETEGYLQLIR
ncbi:MAG TPA: T9SS type B sorting domain-containing protein [Chitinophagales bacterium]|nr:T9SS type B sorting domain-containing protein [Chitinophagales bacterium]